MSNRKTTDGGLGVASEVSNGWEASHKEYLERGPKVARDGLKADATVSLIRKVEIEVGRKVTGVRGEGFSKSQNQLSMLQVLVEMHGKPTFRFDVISGWIQILYVYIYTICLNGV